MKLITLSMAALLATGSIGLACATPVNLVQNGDFSQTHTPTGSVAITPGTPSQLNYTPPFHVQSYGDFVTDWTATGSPYSQNVLWLPDAYDASHMGASDLDGYLFCNPFGGCPRPLLPTSVTASPGGGAFIGMQSNLADSGIQQTINGLAPGQKYTVNFHWAATMDNIDTSAGETSSFTASIDGKSFTTPPQTVSSNGGFLGTHSEPTFNGWLSESFNFVADSSSSVLKFLASGTPSSLPPYALLDGVSIYAVPEPSELAMFGLGLFGLGLLTVVARRRAPRREGEDSNGDIG